MNEKYKWGNMFWTTDGFAWCIGVNFAKGGKPTGEKVIYHSHRELFPGCGFDCDIEYDVYKYTNEDFLKDGENIKKPFEIYIGRACVDKKDYTFSNGKHLNGTFIIYDEISWRKFSDENENYKYAG